MSPKTDEQFKQIRKEKKALIMDSALELFAAHGFEQTSISKIAKHAGISKGLMYNYFDSKEDLIKEIMFEGFNVFVEVFDPNKDGVLTDDEFDIFINETFNILADNTNYWRLYFAAMMQPKVINMVKDKLIESIMPFFKTMTEYYKLRGAENPAEEAMLLGAMLDGVSLNYINNPEMFPTEKIKKLIIKKFKAKPLSQ